MPFSHLLSGLRQRWPVPSAPRPIVSIGAGGIVRDAHLPAYAAMELPVAGLYDIDPTRASETARAFGHRSFDAFPDQFGPDEVIFDVATPPEAVQAILERLPDRAAVLLQKPLGRDLAEADALLETCRRKRLRAAVNFQLRFSPMMLALLDLRDRGGLGELVECEVRVQCAMPWELWPFLRGLQRMEIALHSIHYLDALRALLGEAKAVHARTLQHPDQRDLASTRTSAIFEFSPSIRCSLAVNHHHDFRDPRFAASELRLEGLAGGAVLQMGVNLDYPKGRPDALWFAPRAGDWRAVELVGNWFPDAFRGPMSNLQRFVTGEDTVLVTSVEDAWHTMALVEACYRSDALPMTPVPQSLGLTD